jgi:hypothetical protein
MMAVTRQVRCMKGLFPGISGQQAAAPGGAAHRGTVAIPG